ncbi:universal stress protein [Polaromonas sp. P1(28)-13]|nr:universal stress protein [Polaromonas sp. P1-6]UUZ76096.1 universal stress protein [Polaromonas sp. P1(28)-13]
MYKRILVPIDGSETSNKALVAALQFARDFGGRVRLVHVVDELSYLTGNDHYAGYSEDLIKIMRETGTKVLDDAMAIAQASGVEADYMLFESFGERLGNAVADAAKRWNADLIVVGTHGRRGLGRVLLGSGAEQIVRLAPVPVLVVRSPESESGTRSGA